MTETPRDGLVSRDGKYDSALPNVMGVNKLGATMYLENADSMM